MSKIHQVAGAGVFVPGDDIDTDRIIPARFMKCVTFDGLGEYAFYDVRYHEDGSLREHPLNDPRFASNPILIAGNNFGCGSSREHAPQALYRHGIRAVIAGSFAEIFFGNCTTLGIPCVTTSEENRARLGAAIEANPTLEISINVETREVSFGDETFAVDIPDTAHEALTSGRWDPIAELLDAQEEVEGASSQLPYMAA